VGLPGPELEGAGLPTPARIAVLMPLQIPDKEVMCRLSGFSVQGP